MAVLLHQRTLISSKDDIPIQGSHILIMLSPPSGFFKVNVLNRLEYMDYRKMDKIKINWMKKR